MAHHYSCNQCYGDVWVYLGDTPDDMVTAAQSHHQSTHGTAVTRDDVLTRARELSEDEIKAMEARRDALEEEQALEEKERYQDAARYASHNLP